MVRKKAALTDPDFAEIEANLIEARRPKRPRTSWPFVLFMLVLAGVCIALGFWQLRRLEQKLQLISHVEQRLGSPPIALPPVSEWPAFDPLIYDFQPVTLTGTYVPDQTVMVFTELVDPNGARGGIGYWVVTPMRLTDGGTVMVNRGFVPDATKPLFDGGPNSAWPKQDIQTITGIARVTELPNSFTPGPDLNNRVEHVRNIDRLAAMMDPSLAPIAPIYVNADAAASDEMPQGGETKLSFPNRHMEYAMTWFTFAAIAIIMTGFWLWRQRRP